MTTRATRVLMAGGASLMIAFGGIGAASLASPDGHGGDHHHPCGHGHGHGHGGHDHGGNSRR